jgi:RNA polymerase sigma-70 factor (ECF subfamily)
MSQPDVSELVRAALANNDDAARRLVQHLYPLVAKIVHSHRPRRTSEEDLCQMIFIKVFHNLSSFSGQVPLEHWVSRIAMNTCLNQIASEKVRPEIRYADLSEDEAAIIEQLASSSNDLNPDQKFAARELVEHLLERLKPAERLVIDLLYLQGRSVDDVRQLTGWSAPLVKVRAFRARKKMKQSFEKLSRKENR